jgi:hypothetical protein
MRRAFHIFTLPFHHKYDRSICGLVIECLQRQRDFLTRELPRSDRSRDVYSINNINRMINHGGIFVHIEPSSSRSGNEKNARKRLICNFRSLASAFNQRPIAGIVPRDCPAHSYYRSLANVTSRATRNAIFLRRDDLPWAHHLVDSLDRDSNIAAVRFLIIYLAAGRDFLSRKVTSKRSFPERKSPFDESINKGHVSLDLFPLSLL